MNTKTLIKFGSIAGAIVAILGLLAYAKPVMESDVPPLAGIDRVNKEGIQIAQMNQNFQQQQRAFQQMEQNQLFLAQGFWTNQLAQAQAMLRAQPNNISARQQAITAQQQLIGIQRELQGKHP